MYAWPALQGYIETSPSFRVVDLGGAGGDGGRIASLVWPVLLLLLWTTGIASCYRRLRVTRVRDGALLGGIAAVAAALMLLAVTQLGALRTTWRVRDELLGAGFSGVRIDEAMISAAVLAALAVVAGVVGAAVRGARQRRAPAVAAAPGAPGSAALPQAAPFCPSCGASYGSDEERFCGGCGRPRSPVRPVTPE